MCNLGMRGGERIAIGAKGKKDICRKETCEGDGAMVEKKWSDEVKKTERRGKVVKKECVFSSVRIWSAGFSLQSNSCSRLTYWASAWAPDKPDSKSKSATYLLSIGFKNV